MSLDIIQELACEARHADHMAEMARYWMGRARAAENMLAVAVHSAGGEIRIPHGALLEAQALVLIKEDCPEDFCGRLRTKVKQHA